MGSVGNNTPVAKSIETQIDDFVMDLDNREYGTSKKFVPETQQKEYRALKREITDHINTWGMPESYVVFSSGFARTDRYIHTTAKLNQYQRIVKREAQDIKTDLKLGVINKEQAEKELFVLKSIDATIKRRRQLLKEW